MDIAIGLIFWGGLLLLALSWLARTGLTGRRSSGGGSPGRATAPSPGVKPRGVPQPTTRPAERQQFREEEALSDGLVIGYFLTRDHYQDRIDGLEDRIEELNSHHDRWLDAAATGDEIDSDLDYAEFDAMGGFGVEPWADDLYDLDDED